MMYRESCQVGIGIAQRLKLKQKSAETVIANTEKEKPTVAAKLTKSTQLN